MSDKKFWVLSGPVLPCGARVLGDAGGHKMWVDVCVLGQHMPQMYPPAEIHDLAAEDCAGLGLCGQCSGWGDLGQPDLENMLHAARRVDELSNPCPGCGGSGRPALRVLVTAVPGGLEGSIRLLPHSYVPPLPGGDPLLLAAFEIPPGMCLACGNPEDGKGPRGEALHS